MADYYALVGVDRSAAREEIDHAIRAELRRWQRRAASPDLARRQEAERRVHQLGEARTVLLDDQQRRRYDLQLDAYPSPVPSPSPTPPVPARPRPPARLRPPARPVPGPAARGPQPAPPEAVRWPPRGSPAIPEPGQGTAAAVWRPPAQHGWWVFVLSIPALAVAVGMAGGELGAAAFVLVLLLALLPVPVYVRHRRRRVVLDATGITLRARTIRHIPWAEVRSIQPVTVGNALRVKIRTNGGGPVIAPAPVGVNSVVHDHRFAYQVAVMRRWHAYYTRGDGAATGKAPRPR